GAAITRAAFHPAHPRASQIQKRRSLLRSLGRLAVLLYTASCWRSARFSRARWRWPPQRKGKRRSRWSRRVIIGLGFSPDQGRQINHLFTGRSFAEGQAKPRDSAHYPPEPFTPLKLRPDRVGS